MTIGKKFALVSVAATLALLVVGGAGLYGILTLSQSLQFVTGPAWHAASGAMEGTIGIQQQFVAADAILAGEDAAAAQQAMQEGELSAVQSFARMLDSGLFPESDRTHIDELIGYYTEARDMVLQHYKAFAEANQALTEAFAQYDDLARQAEDVVGYAAMNELENAPDKPITWNGGLDNRWEAAHGAMELRIGMLTRFYHYRGLIGGERASDLRSKMDATLTEMKEQTDELTGLDVFRTEKPGNGLGEGTYAELLREQLEVHRQTFDEAIRRHRALQESDAAYKVAANDLLEAVEKLEEVGVGKLENEIGAIQKTITQSFAVIFAVGALGILFGVLMAVYLTRSVSRPIREVMAGLEEASAEITHASHGFSGASQSLASGTSQQAASLEETSSTLEEVAGMTRENADAARRAEELAETSRRYADDGVTSMNRMGETIGHIESSAGQTAHIIKTIDEIAFQTNLLALNAAVEAARAGEAGRGFAVVAEEVRNLAQRSAEAARSTNTLIDQSQASVQQGVQVAREVEENLSRMNEANRELVDMIRSIASASGEQAEGIRQVSGAMGQIDGVTQSIAANAEQSASASQELLAQSAQLSRLLEMLGGLVGRRAGSDGNTIEAPHDAPALEAPGTRGRAEKPGRGESASSKQPPEQREGLKAELVAAQERQHQPPSAEYGGLDEQDFRDID